MSARPERLAGLLLAALLVHLFTLTERRAMTEPWSQPEEEDDPEEEGWEVAFTPDPALTATVQPGGMRFDACPRCTGPAQVRPQDGALWCSTCDLGFYPTPEAA